MEPTHIPHLLEDELTYELTIRGLPDVGSVHEKRNLLNGICTSLAGAFPVHPPKPDNDAAEYLVCQRKLQQMTGSIQTLVSDPSCSVDSLKLKLEYLKGRILRITASELRVQLLIGWAQLVGELNAKRAALMTRTGDLLTSEVTEHSVPVSVAGLPPADSSFLDRVFQLDTTAPCAVAERVPVTTTAPLVTTTAPPLSTTVPFMPLMQSSFSIPRASPPVPSCSPTDREPNSVFNNYIQVSRWKLKYNGDGSVNAFIERIEEKAASYGLSHEQLFKQAGELFDDKALVWYRYVRNEVHSWEELIQRLRSAFLPSDYEYELWDEIRARTQGPDEKVELYVAVMQNLMNRFAQPVPEPTKLQLIIRNLQPNFQSEILVRQSASLSQLISTCKNMEDNAHRVATFKNPPTRTTALLEPELAYRRARSVVHQAEVTTDLRTLCWNCQSPDHRSVTCPKPRTKYCFSCGKPGVTRPSCPNCRQRSKNGNAAVERSTVVPSLSP